VDYSRYGKPRYRVTATGCWQWLMSILPKGYGCLRISGQLFLAHRWMYERLRGTIAEGMQIDHLCRNRSCVNPDHMEVVSNAENSRRGLMAKLDYGQVADMRGLASRGVAIAQIARMFGVCWHSANKAVRGIRWLRPHDLPVIPANGSIGERNNRAKLTAEDVSRVRVLHRSGVPCVKIASQFGINRHTVNAVVRRKTWKHVT